MKIIIMYVYMVGGEGEREEGMMELCEITQNFRRL